VLPSDNSARLRSRATMRGTALVGLPRARSFLDSGNHERYRVRVYEEIDANTNNR